MNILNQISHHIDEGNFTQAEILCTQLLSDLEKSDDKSENAFRFRFNIAAFFIDLGHMAKRPDLSRKGLDLMTTNHDVFLQIIPLGNLFYNLANAKSDLVSVVNPFELTFQNIEELVEVKNLFWKALKETQKEGKESLKLLINLGNALKRQFRLSEALRCYGIAISNDSNIPQAHVNRSDALKMLNKVSESYSVKMLQEVVDGYKAASKSTAIPSWAEHYEKVALYYEGLFRDKGLTIEANEKEATKDEFEKLSQYRKFCLQNYLTLSEHGLYCACAGSARDNLTIPLLQRTIGGDFVPQMEMILNRIKSEYSLARRNYFDYFHPSQEDIELMQEDCFTELLNSENLGIPIEKLRTSFRLCFGILDKIGLAICTLYDLKPKGQIYFQNCWRLDEEGRRAKFESIKNPGLLALYSIATDLNMHKNGEWACFKDWRNSLEHGLFVVQEKPSSDPYSSFTENLEKVSQKDFLYFVEQLLQLTRSAIFSFVFSVRAFALLRSRDKGIQIELNRLNFKDDVFD